VELLEAAEEGIVVDAVDEGVEVTVGPAALETGVPAALEGVLVGAPATDVGALDVGAPAPEVGIPAADEGAPAPPVEAGAELAGRAPEELGAVKEDSGSGVRVTSTQVAPPVALSEIKSASEFSQT